MATITELTTAAINAFQTWEGIQEGVIVPDEKEYPEGGLEKLKEAIDCLKQIETEDPTHSLDSSAKDRLKLDSRDIFKAVKQLQKPYLDRKFLDVVAHYQAGDKATATNILADICKMDFKYTIPSDYNLGFRWKFARSLLTQLRANKFLELMESIRLRQFEMQLATLKRLQQLEKTNEALNKSIAELQDRYKTLKEQIKNNREDAEETLKLIDELQTLADEKYAKLGEQCAALQSDFEEKIAAWDEYFDSAEKDNIALLKERMASKEAEIQREHPTLPAELICYKARFIEVIELTYDAMRDIRNFLTNTGASDDRVDTAIKEASSTASAILGLFDILGGSLIDKIQQDLSQAVVNWRQKLRVRKTMPVYFLGVDKKVAEGIADALLASDYAETHITGLRESDRSVYQRDLNNPSLGRYINALSSGSTDKVTRQAIIDAYFLIKNIPSILDKLQANGSVKPLLDTLLVFNADGKVMAYSTRADLDHADFQFEQLSTSYFKAATADRMRSLNLTVSNSDDAVKQFYVRACAAFDLWKNKVGVQGGIDWLHKNRRHKDHEILNAMKDLVKQRYLNPETREDKDKLIVAIKTILKKSTLSDKDISLLSEKITSAIAYLTGAVSQLTEPANQAATQHLVNELRACLDDIVQVQQMTLRTSGIVTRGLFTSSDEKKDDCDSKPIAGPSQ